MSIHIMIQIASEDLVLSTETYDFLTQSQKVGTQNCQLWSEHVKLEFDLMYS